jgi:1-acyl-sn-glycerol-3-phosphate acyltransferase
MIASLRLSARAALAASSSAALFSALQVDKAVRPLEGTLADARRDPYVRAWARSLLQILGVERVDASTGPALEEGGHVVISNHRSTLDILLMLDLFGGHLLARGDMASWPVIGKLAREAGTLFVDREDPSSGAGAVQRVRSRLREGRTITVFPEGTTFCDDQVRAFHPGAFVAAAREKVPIVPVGIAYESVEACYGDESIGEHGKRLLTAKRTRVAVAIGPSIPSKGTSLTALRDLAHHEVQSLVHAARRAL